MSGSEHLAIVPIVLPLAFGAMLLLLDERRHATKALVSLISFSLLPRGQARPGREPWASMPNTGEW